MSKGPHAEVIAATRFYGVPGGLCAGGVAADQDRGSDAARLIECAGRCCDDSYGKGRGSTEFHAHLREVKHGSVLEHFHLSFSISGISRGCSHELVRHRHAAISQRSTRSVDESESEWAWHPALVEAEWPVLRSFQSAAQALYQQLVDELTREGMGRKQARGAARGVLGNALETALVWTVNRRSLRHFLELRATEYADGEIRLLANRVYEAARAVTHPWLEDDERADCPDGIGDALTTAHGGL